MTAVKWPSSATETTQLAARESPRRLHSTALVNALLEATGHAVLEIDPTGKIVGASEAAARLFETPISELLGVEIEALISRPAVPWRSLLDRLTGPGSIVSDAIRDELVATPGGKKFSVELRLAAWQDEEQRGILAAVRDMSSLGSAAKALLSHHEPLHQIANNIEDAFYIRELDHNRLVYASPALERIMGVAPSEGPRPRRWLDSVHPGDRLRVREGYEQLLRGDPFDEEYRVFREDGRLIWLHDRAFLVRDDQGDPLRVIGVLREITDRRHLEHELEHAQRVEAIGTLAASIAHDMGNILAGIGACAKVIRRSSLDATQEDLIQEVLRSVDRGTSYVGHLLDYCRKKQARLEPVVVSAVVQDVATLMSAILDEGIELRVDDRAGEARVEADPVQLEQVIMNLALNARDAIGGSGTLEIHTRLAESGPSDAPRTREDSPHSWVEVSVRDNGCGMSDEVQEHLFEPFFTTKCGGNGLGLSTADAIVRRLGGGFEVKSKLGEGTTFTIRLPRRP